MTEMAVAGGEVGLELSLRRAEALIGSAAAVALALDDFAINLPPVSVGAVDQAQLRAIATLYLASELEAAGVIPAVETLTRLARSGSLPVDLGSATALVQAFWQGRNERATGDERRGFFSGLFGTSGPENAAQQRNLDFEELLIDLCEALYKLDEQASNTSWGGVAQQARVRRAAQRLIVNLVGISSRITVFLAQEILAALRSALQILGHPAVKAAFRARTPWEVVAAIERWANAGERIREYDLHLRRGQAGMTLLAWLADAAPVLDAEGKPIVGLDHPVVVAAIEWLEASLALSERVAPVPAKADGSPWAALAG
ncbi:MAG: hypothetical protein ACYCYR_12545 [Desulfobulbaceae bacterium]|jgi:hypothetical protein